ncbi:MAG: DNA cytosine methyltransferase [Candidatus Dehalobacter alkaniphilus]
MRVLVACEESQAVTKELRKLGHEAYSCDLEPCSGGHPEWHLQQDVIPLLAEKWDMIIAFPPCTYLSNVGANRLFPQSGVINQERYEKGLKAKEFFMQFYNADCPRIAIENPIATKIYELPPYAQIIQPYEYGHPFSKKTCLWLKGLPKLVPTEILDRGRERVTSWVSGGSKNSKGEPRKNKGTKIRDAKTRSKTFPGIAKAMAEQWGGKVETKAALMAWLDELLA